MSRILRRPMFRGGRVDSRGTGITSGLDRPGLSSGGMPPSTVVTGSQLLNQASRQNLDIGSLNPKSNYSLTPQSPLYNLGQAALFDVAQYPLVGTESKISSPLSTFYGMQDDSETDSDTEGLLVSTDQTMIPEKSVQAYEEFPEDKKETEPKQTEKISTNIPPKKPIDLGDDDEVSLTDVEKSKKEYAELLGIQKARSRDIYDMLGRFSAASLNAPSLRDAFADYMALEAKAGPGRAERIQEAAGTIAVKEKIAGKQLDKRIAAALAKGDKGTDMTRMISLLKDKSLDSTTRQVILSKIGRQPSIQAELNKLRLEGNIDASTVNQIAPLYISDYVGILTPASKEDGVYLNPSNKELIRLEKGKPTSIGTLNY